MFRSFNTIAAACTDDKNIMTYCTLQTNWQVSPCCASLWLGLPTASFWPSFPWGGGLGQTSPICGLRKQSQVIIPNGSHYLIMIVLMLTDLQWCSSVFPSLHCHPLPTLSLSFLLMAERDQLPLVGVPPPLPYAMPPAVPPTTDVIATPLTLGALKYRSTIV